MAAIAAAVAMMAPAGVDAATMIVNNTTVVDTFVIDEVYSAANANTSECACGYWAHAFQLDLPGSVLAEFSITSGNLINLLDAPNTLSDITLSWYSGVVFSGDLSLLTPVSSISLATSGIDREMSLLQEFAMGETFTMVVDWENTPTSSVSISVSAIVTTIPVPAAGLLLMSALGGLAVVGRRRKASV